jgi:hypothetical protein
MPGVPDIPDLLELEGNTGILLLEDGSGGIILAYFAQPPIDGSVKAAGLGLGLGVGMGMGMGAGFG